MLCFTNAHVLRWLPRIAHRNYPDMSEVWVSSDFVCLVSWLVWGSIYQWACADRYWEGHTHEGIVCALCGIYNSEIITKCLESWKLRIYTFSWFQVRNFSQGNRGRGKGRLNRFPHPTATPDSTDLERGATNNPG